MCTKTLTVMNKNHPVLDFLYDTECHYVEKILECREIDYAPLAFFDREGNVTRTTVTDWWRGRAIPASRQRIRGMLFDLDIDSTFELLDASNGLSLSDRYWIDDPQSPKRWEDINFFDNDFSGDLGFYTLGQEDCLVVNPSFMSPDATTGGNLQKKWVIEDGQRMLVKSGEAQVKQEAYNEVVATCLYRRLLPTDEYVPYRIHKERGSTFCICPNMLGEDEEFIPAYQVLKRFGRPNGQSDWQFAVSGFERCGLDSVEEFLSKMLVCDFIMGNFDRHLNNFGVIRNVETLECTRFAPLFDSGNSLWCDKWLLDNPIDYEYVALPFAQSSETDPRRLARFDWFAPERLEGFVDEAASILEKAPNLPDGRIERIRIGMEAQIDKLM